MIYKIFMINNSLKMQELSIISWKLKKIYEFDGDGMKSWNWTTLITYFKDNQMWLKCLKSFPLSHAIFPLDIYTTALTKQFKACYLGHWNLTNSSFDCNSSRLSYPPQKCVTHDDVTASGISWLADLVTAARLDGSAFGLMMSTVLHISTDLMSADHHWP